jgi:chemotaxis protein MotB
MQKKIFVIKKIKKKSHAGHHGGSWKIAYADFVTAMMAFFLMLWLIQIISDAQKKGIADYFSKNIVPSRSKISPKSTIAGSGTSKSEKESLDRNHGKISVENKLEVIKEVLVNAQKIEQKKFNDLSKRLEIIISKKKDLKFYMTNIEASIIPEGIKIQIFDNNQRSMFPSGSDILHPEVRELFKIIAEVIRPLSNPIDISGHTDAYQFSPSKNYTNWELSADRANTARRAIEQYDIPKKRFVCISGKETSEPLVPEDPFSPKNRRITITLLREYPLTPDPLKRLQLSKVKLESDRKL